MGCHRDAMIIAFANCSTSIFAGFVIFSIIGFMAKQSGLPVEDVIKGGPGLAFIAYPDAVAQMPVPQLWSFLFFFMLITLGLDSQFTMTETLTTAVMDQYPNLRAHRGKVVIGASILGFILGLSMCTKGGVFMFELMDISVSWSIIICAIIEILIVSWAYGFNRLLSNIKEMGIWIPLPMKFYYITKWAVITPIILIKVLILTLINYSLASSSMSLVHKFDYVFPSWVQALGFMMSVLPVVSIYLGFFHTLWSRNRNGQLVGLKSMMSPTEKFCSSVQSSTGVENVALESQHYLGNTNQACTYKYQEESSSNIYPKL